MSTPEVVMVPAPNAHASPVDRAWDWPQTAPLEETFYKLSECVTRALKNLSRTIQEGIEGIHEEARTQLARAKQRIDAFDPIVRDTAVRLYLVASTILKVLAAGALFATQSTLFTLGFLAGIVQPQMIQNATQRICDSWDSQTCLARGLIVGGAIIAWPISLAASAFFVGGKVGLACQNSRIF